MKKIDRKLIIILLLVLPVIFIWISHHYLTGFTIYNDGIGYYVYDRSIAIDGDVNFTNEWQYYNSSFSKFSAVPRGINAPTVTTPLGFPENHYLIGNALLWLPFFLAVHLPLLILNLFTTIIPANGFSWPYEIIIGASSIIYGTIGLILTYKLCKKFYDGKISLLATIGIWYGTGVFWYHSVEPSMSHILALFVEAAFLYVWYTTLNKRRTKEWIALGFLGSLIFLVRQQDAIIFLLPALEFIRSGFLMLKNKKITTIAIKNNLSNGLLFVAGMLPALLLQIIVWKMLFGRFLVYSYTNAEQTGGGWILPQLIPFFFSIKDGMITVPAMMVGLVGLFLFARKNKFAGRGFLGVTILSIIVASSWVAWDNGYGLRFLVGLSPLFALGLAEILHVLREKSNDFVMYGVIGILIIANIVSMIMFLLIEVGSRISIFDIPRMLIEIIA